MSAFRSPITSGIVGPGNLPVTRNGPPRLICCNFTLALSTSRRPPSLRLAPDRSTWSDTTSMCTRTPKVALVRRTVSTTHGPILSTFSATSRSANSPSNFEFVKSNRSFSVQPFMRSHASEYLNEDFPWIVLPERSIVASSPLATRSRTKVHCPHAILPEDAIGNERYETSTRS
jgi:hypothetical protein